MNTIRINGREVSAAVIEQAAADLGAGPEPSGDAVRLAVARALLAQRADALGLAGNDDEEATLAALIAHEVASAQPTEEECRRYYDGHPERFTVGDSVTARHILFAVTPGVPVEPLRRKAEATLLELLSQPARFAELARTLSNCPSGAQGGELGELRRGDTAPEFERTVFEGTDTGVLPRMVNTRYGFHIVCVDARHAGHVIPYERVGAQITEKLAERAQAQAFARYIARLADEAEIEGAEIDFGAALPMQ